MKRGRRPLDEILTPEQKELIRKEYPNRPSAEIAREAGMSLNSLRIYTHRHGIRKSREYLFGVRSKAGMMASKVNAFQKGHVPKKMTDDVRTERNKKISQKLKELFRKERLREEYGLPRKTKLRVTSLSAAHRMLSYRLRKKGYVIDEDKHIAYYSESTKRSMLMESRNTCFTYKSVNDVNEEKEEVICVPENPFVNTNFSFT